ncbi:MAG: nuclear transport factor 2 family protein [Pyrinomonadaceae bacterium]|nr:nuclear transport factor 2 family protein [Acidobacteriota bacterium]MBK7933301.1 nuclear transport factor 2 family protein [Acidobacteriota bacterium]MBP7374851.1 nuclear transport factor 2 family protein [Pyrinomonadaceae bacterium]
MKKAIFIAFTIALLTFSAFGQKAVKADPKKAVNAAFDRLVEGIKQVDLDKVMAAYEKSDRLLIFNNNGSATIGWENVRSVNEKIYARLSNVSLEITGLRVEMLSANTAYVSCKWKQTQENDGKLESASGRMTLVYKLIGKEWKVVHRHTSPDNPDATRPVFPSERTN